MGEECSEGSCCESEKECCGSKGCCEEEKSMGAMIMKLANEAWDDLMKEKMKSSYEKAMGSKMDKAAQIGVEACIMYWGNKMKGKVAWAEFEEKLSKAMM